MLTALAALGVTPACNGAPAHVQTVQTASRPEAARQALFNLLQPVRLANCRLERFGEPYDGGYLLCANLLDGAQAGYSYGIDGYDQWGCDVSRKRHVTVHEYDCFNREAPACPEGRTAFHAECVGPRPNVVEEGRLFDTVQDQTVKNGDGGRHLVMKMDVEGAEWDSLLQAPESLLDRIDQLDIEFHKTDEERFVRTVSKLKQFFYPAYLHFNNFSCEDNLAPFPAWAYEVLFVSKRLGRLDRSGAPPVPSELAEPNDPTIPDCQTTAP